MGDSSLDLSSAASNMDGAVTMLRSDLAVFGVTLQNQSSGFAGIGNWFNSAVGGSTSQEAAEHALQQWQVQVEDLAGRQRDQVLEGTQSFSGWNGTARALHQEITSTNAETDGWSFGGVLSQTTQATVEEVKKDAAIAGLISLPIIIGAGALYALLIFGRR